MEQDTSEQVSRAEGNNLIPASIIIAGMIVAGGILLDAEGKLIQEPPKKLEKAETVSGGIALPANFGDLGQRMAENGTIDPEKLSYAEEFDGGRLVITRENASRMLNVLWALGLSSKNEILEKGEMADPRYGGPHRFASTAGWTVARGDAMEHYSRHHYFDLSPEEQEMVARVAKDTYRPCCGNSAHFPDCNHGMAMLGLLELMASQGASEEEMTGAASIANAAWFPDSYPSPFPDASSAPVRPKGCSV